MQFQADSLGLSGTVTTILRDLIHEHLGLHYEPHQFDQVADRLAPLVVAHGLSSFMDYYYLLKYSADTAEWLRVMDALAVQETYFWREIDQLRAVVRHLLPELVEATKPQPLRIWSIPCASGEEPLTLAILLSEAGWFERADIELHGSDASPHAVDKARRGIYTQRAFRNLPAHLWAKYFTPVADGWQVVPSLHRRVTFDVVNLLWDEQVARRASSVPVIVCRNVFIYFSDKGIQHVLGTFERAMPAPAYLCVGAAESLLRHRSSFELEEVGGAFVYARAAQGGRSGSSALVTGSSQSGQTS